MSAWKNEFLFVHFSLARSTKIGANFDIAAKRDQLQYARGDVCG